MKPQKVYNAYVSSRRVLFCFENTAIYEMYHVISIYFKLVLSVILQMLLSVLFLKGKQVK